MCYSLNMRRIPDLVQGYVLETPLFEEHLSLWAHQPLRAGAASATAPPRALLRPVSEASVVMALRRLGPASPRGRTARHPHLPPSDLTVRFNVVELTFDASDAFARSTGACSAHRPSRRCVRHLHRGGATEVMLMVSAGLEGEVLRIFAGERLLSKVRDLSAIVIRLTPSSVETPGGYYAILRAPRLAQPLMWSTWSRPTRNSPSSWQTIRWIGRSRPCGGTFAAMRALPRELPAARCV